VPKGRFKLSRTEGDKSSSAAIVVDEMSGLVAVSPSGWNDLRQRPDEPKSMFLNSANFKNGFKKCLLVLTKMFLERFEKGFQ
jgi:hypothetical protein